MRLPYIPLDPQMSTPADQAVVDRIKARRGGTLIPLDQTLLHAPPVADGWNSFLRSIRTETTLGASVRELAICRVAALNGAWFEWEAHCPLLEAAGVLDAAAVADLRDPTRPVAERLDAPHRAVLEYTDAMTKGCVVPEATFRALKASFGDREVVEITATVAAYNCVSRFLVALDVGEMAEKHGVDMS